MRVATVARTALPQFQNLVLRSEDFGNAYWAKDSASIQSAAAAGPLPGMSADGLVDTVANASHGVYRGNGDIALGPKGRTATFSIYAKAAAENTVAIWTNGFGGISTFRLDTAAVSAGGAVSASMALVAPGWYRCVATYVLSAVDDSGWEIAAGHNGSVTYVGTAARAILISGAQAVISNRPGPYTKTVAAVVGATGIRALP